jgi:hypothetical protein
MHKLLLLQLVMIAQVVLSVRTAEGWALARRPHPK